jgi:beta-glucosidase
MFSLNRTDFPSSFAFGVAMAAHQIEGGQTDGRGSSIWDTFAATPGNVKNGDNGIIACDHYNRWPEDLDLIRDAGFDAYRFSLSWPRVRPAGRGPVNQAGLDFYDRLVDGMLERGIQPHATLYHWDLPSALQDHGGWMNRDTTAAFAEYADVVSCHLGDRLTSIATINEPWCVAFLSHFLGYHAPGYSDVRAASRAMHHILLAHGRGIEAMRANGHKNLGIVVNMEKCEPLTNSAADHAAAELGDAIFNRWYIEGVTKGTYPKLVTDIIEGYMPEGWQDDMSVISQPLDWVGLNYYTRSLYKSDASVPVFPFTQSRGPLDKNELGWEVYPSAMTDFLVRIKRDYTDLPIYLTENGTCETDDARRVEFFDLHLKALKDAIDQGVDARGYFAWTLIDNFEWAEGYSAKFGIVGMDPQTLSRQPRASYEAFRTMLKSVKG